MTSQPYDFDELRVYENIEEALDNEDYTFGDLAEEYGTFEAVNLTNKGTIADHSERELFVRGSRIPEAEMEAAYIQDGLQDAGRNIARAAAGAMVPGVAGFLAVETGGDPLWVGAAIASTAAETGTIKDSAIRTVKGLYRRKMEHDFERQYELNRVAEEDYALGIIGDAEYSRKIMETSDTDDVDIRDQGVLMAGTTSLSPEEVEEEEFNGDLLEPQEDDEFE